MRGRNLVISAGAEAFALAGTRSARAQTARTLKFGYSLSSGSPFGLRIIAFEAEVIKRTKGRCQVDHYPDSLFGDEAEIVENLRQGRLDLGIPTAAQFDVVRTTVNGRAAAQQRLTNLRSRSAAAPRTQNGGSEYERRMPRAASGFV